jgi:L-ribulokinase
MSLVIGVDFGTLSVRVSVFDHQAGRLSSGSASYPLRRKKGDPLGGVTPGWNLTHGPEDEFFAAIEGTAFDTRIILEHMQTCGVPVARVINGGGIPRGNELLNQIYANVLNKPVVTPGGDVTGLGAAAFAFMTAGTIASLEDAQEALCPRYKIYEPQAETLTVYDELFDWFKRLYYALGTHWAKRNLIRAI